MRLQQGVKFSKGQNHRSAHAIILLVYELDGQHQVLPTNKWLTHFFFLWRRVSDFNDSGADGGGPSRA